MEPSVFEHSTATDYLNKVLEYKRSKNRRFSIRAWSSRLGFKNASYLQNVLTKKRSLNAATVGKLVINLKMSVMEKRRFELLALFENSKSCNEHALYKDLLDLTTSCSDSKSPARMQTLEADVFHFMPEWYHVAIIEMLGLKGFEYDLDKICRSLDSQITTQQARDAIVRLVGLKILVVLPGGRLKRSSGAALFHKTKTPSAAVRSFHKQMIHKGLLAIDAQTFLHRDLRGSTVAIDSSNYAAALEILQDAHLKILQLATPKNADVVYQLNTQFFRLAEI